MPMPSAESTQPASAFQLVLSIFKGANLVVKNSAGTQLKIVARVGETVWTSGNYHLSSTTSYPDFNYQVAWKLTKKELQELRLSRGVVKVDLYEVPFDSQSESLIGSCTVSVKDAVEISSYDEIDVRSAKPIPLKGTKSPWRHYGPQLLYILHVEDPDKPIEPPKLRKRTSGRKTPAQKKEMAGNAASNEENSSKQMPEDQFRWSVNDKIGCFLLGDEGPEDDLYVMSIVTVGVRRFEALLPPKDQRTKQELVISGHCFGVAFEGDVFELETKADDPDHLTYLGDRCTARIRASAPEFTRFLSEFVLELKVFQVVEEVRVLLGRIYVPFNSLCDPNSIEIRGNYEVISDRVTKESPKPEVGIIVDLKRSPRCFERAVKIEEIKPADVSMSQSKEDIFDSTTYPEARKSDREPVPVSSVQQKEDEELAKALYESLKIGQQIAGGDARPFGSTAVGVSSEKQLGEKAKSYDVHEVKTTGNQIEVQYESPPISSSTSVTNTLSTRSVPARQVKFVAGTYKVCISFEDVSIKTKYKPQGEWCLSFFHPPLGVYADNKCELALTINHRKTDPGSHKVFFDVKDNEEWNLQIPKLTDDILNIPMDLRIDFPGQLKKPRAIFGSVVIGNIFRKELVGGTCQVQEHVKLFHTSKTSEKNVRIGAMKCNIVLTKISKENQSFLLQQESDSCIFEASCAPKTPCAHKTPYAAKVASEGNVTKAPRVRQPLNDIDEWKIREEELQSQLKARNDAYLKMLSEEFKKQKGESEKEINKKLEELEELKSSYDKKFNDLKLQDEKLMRRRKEFEDSNLKATAEIRIALQELQMKYKHLEMEKRMQVEGLQRQLKDKKAALEAASSKIQALEKMLESKNVEIATLHSEKANWPETQAIRRIEGLEQENKQLKSSLKTMTEDRDKYKLRYEKETQERYKELIHENQSLKQALMQQSTSKSSTVFVKDAFKTTAEEHTRLSQALPVDHHGEEISRYSSLRAYLLSTCAYTPYSDAIQEIEAKILRHIELKEKANKRIY